MTDIYKTLVLLRRDGSGVSSGGLVAPGIVMTALHNIFPPNELPDIVPENVVCPAVRITGDFDVAIDDHGDVPMDNLREFDVERILAHPMAAFRRCRLLWPVANTPMPGEDVALLQIDPAAAETSRFADSPPEFSIGADSEGEVTVTVGGFPRFEKETAGRNSELFRTAFWSECTTRNTSENSGSFRRNAELIVAGLHGAKSHKHWSGMSGSPLWQEGLDGSRRLVGVVTEAKPDVQNNSVLFFQDLRAIKDQEGFFANLGKAPTDAKAVRSVKETLNDGLIHFDRKGYRTRLERWLLETAPPEPASVPRLPLVIPFAGHVVDESEIFIDTCLEIMQSDACLAFGRYSEKIDLGVPLDLASAEEGLDELRDQWGEMIGISGYGTVPDVDELAAAMLEPTRQKVVVLEHGASEMSEACEGTIEGVVDIFARIAALSAKQVKQTKTAQAPPMLFLSFILGRSCSDEERAYLPTQLYEDRATRVGALLERLASAHPQLNWCPNLPALNRKRCLPADMRAWISGLATGGCTLDDTVKQMLTDPCEPHEQFPVRYARNVVNRAIAACEL